MRQPIIVILSDKALDRIQQIVGQLADAGMYVERTLPLVGAIGGTAMTDALPALRQIEGVVSVEAKETANPPA